jgi:WD40 repeat protein
MQGATLSDTAACESVDSVAFAGELLAVGCGNGNTLLWNVADANAATRSATLAADDCDSVVIAFATDGKTLAAGCANGKTQLWDVAAAAKRGAPLGDPAACGSVYSVAFAPEGTTLAAGCSEGTIQLWDGVLWTSDADLQRRVCGLVWRSLAEPEWSTLVPGLPYRASCPGT